MGRLKLATVWLGGCSGCHMSFLDLDEFLIDLADQADVVYTPIMDVKEYPEGVDVALVEGAIANEEHLADDPADPTSGRGCWSPSAIARSPATSPRCATRSARPSPC